MSDLYDEKRKLRDKECLLRRAAMLEFSDGMKNQFFCNLRSVLIKLSEYSTVASFLAIGDEIDMLPIMEEIWGEGYNCVLPVVIAEDAPLRFRIWSPRTILIKGPYSTRHPSPDAEEMVDGILEAH